MIIKPKIYFFITGLALVGFYTLGGTVNLGAENPPAAAPPLAVAAADKPSAGRALVDSGVDKYNNGNYRGALDDLAAALKNPLTVEEKVMAFEYLGFVHMAYNREKEALTAFEEAVKLNPSLSLDPATVSPKILEVFRRAKSRVIRVGSLIVNTNPPGAEVFLDGKPVGKTPLNLREVIVGRYKVKVARDNYGPQEREIELKENAEANIGFELVSNAGILSVVTNPPGATVYVDEVPQGTTPVTIKNITAGERNIALRMEGMEDYHDKLVVKPGAILTMELKMVEGSGSAYIKSNPSEAEVYINGKLKGKTPVLVERMTSGKNNLLLAKAGVGKWEGDLIIKKGQKTEITGELRPSICIIPPLAVEGPEPENPQEAERETRFLFALKELGNMNIIRYDKKKHPNLFKEIGILPSELVQKNSRENMKPDQLLSSLQGLGRELKADLLLVGVYKDKSKGEVTWSLFNLYHVVPDTFEAKISADEKDIKYFHQFFQSSWRLRYPWLGLVAAETWLSPNPLVIQVPGGGPAARAGVELGDGIIGINKQKIKNNRELQDLLAKKEVGESITLEILRKKTPQTKNIKLEAGLSEISLGDPKILYNLAMVELELQKGAENVSPQEAAAAQLNIALCYMNFQTWEKAAEILETVKFSDSTGICQGTALFRLGQCYEGMGQWKKAVETYEKIKNYPGCTLINPDDTLAYQEAAIRLKYLAQRGLGK